MLRLLGIEPNQDQPATLMFDFLSLMHTIIGSQASEQEMLRQIISLLLSTENGLEDLLPPGFSKLPTIDPNIVRLVLSVIGTSFQYICIVGS